MISLTRMASDSPKLPKYPYETDYNDHFETPLAAYQDVMPLISLLLDDDLSRRVYDPYFCQGQAKEHLQSLGLQKVIHHKRDFYKDIRNNHVPKYDLLITNPPYSDQHKKQCLEYCFQRLRQDNVPFLLLMPTYVASKQYYRSYFENHVDDVVYILPSGEQYQYQHPQGTGKDNSPFDSLWFCGVGPDRRATLLQERRFSVIGSVQDLRDQKIIAARNRPGARRRRKRNRTALPDNVSIGYITVIATESNEAQKDVTSDQHPRKKSKYRNEDGEREKRRF